MHGKFEMKLLLYGTRFCHLCEQAVTLLEAVGVTAQQIDIAEDNALIERYGARIPVVYRVDNGVEIDWPFDGVKLKVLMASAPDHE